MTKTIVLRILSVLALVSLSACAGSNFSGLRDDSTYTPNGDAAQAGASANAQPGTVNGDSYRISPQDVLDISVFKEPDLQRMVTVRPDGGISFPLAGNVDAAGKTVNQLTQVLTKRIHKYIPAAVVNVSVNKIAGYNIFVIGKVNKPGQYTVGSYVDVLQALTLAGGLTPFANEDSITIRRRENGQENILPFDYSAVTAGENKGQNVRLQSGDVVVVP